MTKFALCVGVNAYPGAELAGCVPDAEGWAEALGDRGFDDVVVLLDGDATRERIVRGIRVMLDNAGSGDTVVFTYSGHGTWIPDANGDEPDHRDEALCPVDYRSGLLVDDDLFELFDARHRGVRVVLVSDSCHSGSVNRLAEPLGSGRGRVRFLPPVTFLDPGAARGEGDPDILREALKAEGMPSRGKPRAGALLLAGCRDTEYSYDAWFNGRPNGAFSYVALGALRGLPAGASYLDWYRAIRRQLPSQDYPQTPQLVGTSRQRHWPAL